MAKPDNKDKREARQEEEKASEKLLVVIDGAILECKLCTIPIGMLKVNFDTPTIQGKKTATVMEKDSSSLIFMGTCIKSPNSAVPCAAVMQLGQWKDTGTVLIQDQKPLLQQSTIMCNYGGSEIKITDAGQINVPTNVEEIVSSPKEIISAIWIDNDTKEEIKNANAGDNVNFLVQTKNYKEGDFVFLDITEKDGGEVKDGKTLITVAGIVKADGSAELKKPHTL